MTALLGAGGIDERPDAYLPGTWSHIKEPFNEKGRK